MLSHREPNNECRGNKDLRWPSRDAWLTLLAFQAALLAALVGWMVVGAPEQMREDAALRRTPCAPVLSVCMPIQRLRGGLAPHGCRRRTALVAATLISLVGHSPAGATARSLDLAASPAKLSPAPAAGPDSNGAMEERYNLGLPAFTAEYLDPDPEPSLPLFPVLGAQRSIDRLLADEEQFRRLLKAGFPTGELQTPPVLSPLLFERLEARAVDAAALREAAQAYVREARDVDELVAFAQRSRRLGSEAEVALRLGEAAVRDAEVDEYLDKALLACRRASQALGRIVSLLPRAA